MIRTFKPQNCLVAFRLPVLLLRKADFLAAQADKTRSQLFRRSIVEFLGRNGMKSNCAESLHISQST